MTVTKDTPLVGPAEGSPVQAFACVGMGHVREDDIQSYLAELFRLAPLVGLNPLILAAQSAHETGFWSSYWWAHRLNPAGIGITGDPAQNQASGTWKTGTDAARAQIVHMGAYVLGDTGVRTSPLREFIELDPRYSAVLQAGYGGTVKKIGDLGSGVWATDPEYAAGLCRHANAILSMKGETPVPTNEIGQIPKPPVWIQHTHGVEGQSRYAGSVPRDIHGSATHTMVGTLLGTNSWFQSPVALGLTDYGIGGPWDGDEWNGVVIEWIDPSWAVSPYANGVVGKARPAFGDAARYIDAFGIEPAINAGLRSIEHSDAGQPQRDRPWAGQVDMSCLLKAWIHVTQAGQTPETFDWHVYHAETGTDHAGCPGAWFWANADVVCARVVEIANAYLHRDMPLGRPLTIVHPPDWTGDRVPTPAEYWAAKDPAPTPVPAPTPTPEPQPTPVPTPAPAPKWAKPIPPPDFEGMDVLDKSQKAWVAAEHTYTVVQEAPRLRTANRNAPPVRHPLAVGARFHAPWQVHGGGFIKGDKRPENEQWAVTVDGSRVPLVCCELEK